MREGEAGAELGVIGLDGAVRVLATASHFGRPIWSPGGGLLLVLRADQLEIIDVETGHVTPVRGSVA